MTIEIANAVDILKKAIFNKTGINIPDDSIRYMGYVHGIYEINLYTDNYTATIFINVNTGRCVIRNEINWITYSIQIPI